MRDRSDDRGANEHVVMPAFGYPAGSMAGRRTMLVGFPYSQARRGVPAEDLQDSFQLPGNLVQYQTCARAVVVFAAGPGQADDGSQAGEVTERHVAEADVDFRYPSVSFRSVSTRPAWLYSSISPAIARTAGLLARLIRNAPSS
jgi:hypothetical protein